MQQTPIYISTTLTESLHRAAEDKQETVKTSSTEPNTSTVREWNNGENLEREQKLFMDERSCMTEQFQGGKYVDVQGIQGASVSMMSTAADYQKIQKRVPMKTESIAGADQALQKRAEMITEPTAVGNQALKRRAQMKSKQLTVTLDNIHQNDTSDYMKLIKAREDTCDDDDYQPLLTRDSPSDDHEPDYDYTSSLENIYQPLLMDNDTKGSRDSIYQALFSGPDPQT